MRIEHHVKPPLEVDGASTPPVDSKALENDMTDKKNGMGMSNEMEPEEEGHTNRKNETGMPDKTTNGDMRRPQTHSPMKEITDLSIDLSGSDSPQRLSPFGSYTWAKEASVVTTNTTVQVVATSPQDMSSVERVMGGMRAGPSDKVNYIAFSFVGNAAAHEAKDLFWDPETSVEYSTSGALRTSASTWLTMAGAMFFWTMVV